MQNMKDQQTVMKYILGKYNCASFLSYFLPACLFRPSWCFGFMRFWQNNKKPFNFRHKQFIKEVFPHAKALTIL
jgi:hypothetical protein